MTAFLIKPRGLTWAKMVKAWKNAGDNAQLTGFHTHFSVHTIRQYNPFL